MNEFQAKKLGEVSAFCEAGIEIMEKGRDALSKVDINTSNDYTNSLENQHEKIIKLSQKYSVTEIVENKTQKTKQKLLTMAQMYIGDEWDNPAELLEWLGFFEGAALVHWKLVQGVAENINDEELTALSNEGYMLHKNLLEHVEKAIFEFGLK